jgi:aminopeptidase N
MADVSGQELGTFFEQWTRRAGHPVIKGTWRHDAAAGECVVTLRQTQDGPPFTVPVDLAVTADSSRTSTVSMATRTTEARLPCSQPPSSLSLDPQVRLLGEFSMTRK